MNVLVIKPKEVAVGYFTQAKSIKGVRDRLQKEAKIHDVYGIEFWHEVTTPSMMIFHIFSPYGKEYSKRMLYKWQQGIDSNIRTMFN